MLGLVGHSRGGGIAVLYTAADPRVRALVTWAAISPVERWPQEERPAWRVKGRKDVPNIRTGQMLPLYPDVLDDIEGNASALDIEAAAEQIRVPWLIIHGTEDESVGYQRSRVAEGRKLGNDHPIAPGRGGSPHLRRRSPLAGHHSSA